MKKEIDLFLFEQILNVIVKFGFNSKSISICHTILEIMFLAKAVQIFLRMNIFNKDSSLNIDEFIKFVSQDEIVLIMKQFLKKATMFFLILFDFEEKQLQALQNKGLSEYDLWVNQLSLLKIRNFKELVLVYKPLTKS